MIPERNTLGWLLSTKFSNRFFKFCTAVNDFRIENQVQFKYESLNLYQTQSTNANANAISHRQQPRRPPIMNDSGENEKEVKLLFENKAHASSTKQALSFYVGLGKH